MKRDCRSEVSHLLNHTIFKDFFFKVRQYALQSSNESCGIATINHVFLLKNIHENPKICFEINPEDYFKFLQSETILFIWHSHVSGRANPSAMDVKYAYEHTHKSLIYSCQDDNFCFFQTNPFCSVYFSI